MRESPAAKERTNENGKCCLGGHNGQWTIGRVGLRCLRGGGF